MATLYFGFAIADSMFSDGSTIVKTSLGPTSVQAILEESQRIVSCCNPSHTATIRALERRYYHIAQYIEIPKTAPQVQLGSGDSIIVMSVRGLPRLEGRHEYTDEEIEKASFVFSIYEVK